MKMNRAHGAMMVRGVILCEVVTNIGAARAPVNEELATTGTILNPIKAHVNGFGYFCLMALLAKPAAVELSTQSGVKVWACQILARVVQMGMASWQLRTVAPIFGFGVGGHDIGKNIGKGGNGDIDGEFTRRGLISIRGMITKELIAASAASSFGIG